MNIPKSTLRSYRMLCIENEESVEINGQWYWTIKSFSTLTQRTERIVRHLVRVGNRIRKLKGHSINGRVYIEEQELFNFLFVTGGRPADMGDFVEKFCMEDGQLLREEVCIERCLT